MQTGRTSDLVLKPGGPGKHFYRKQLLIKSEVKVEVSQALRPQQGPQREKQLVRGLARSQTIVLGAHSWLWMAGVEAVHGQEPRQTIVLGTGSWLWMAGVER